MKKLLLLMAGCAALFSSCLKDYEGTSAPSTLPYYSLYINTMNQSVFSLDPFDVAFRLNTLIVEGNGDYEAAPQGVRDTLFAPGTMLSYNETDGRYTLQYNGRAPHMKNDYTRMGDLIIKTNGYATLTEPGARWNIEFSPAETKYRIVDGSASVSMTSTSYIVSLTSTNQWAVTMSGMATTQSASNLELGLERDLPDRFPRLLRRPDVRCDQSLALHDFDRDTLQGKVEIVCRNVHVFRQERVTDRHEDHRSFLL